MNPNEMNFANLPPEPPDELPVDLVGIAARLDALSTFDRSANPGLETRIFAASIPELVGVAEVQARLVKLGEAERLSAGVGLEERVARASIKDLRSTRSVRGVGSEGGGRRRTQHRRWIFTAASMRIAAGVLVIVTGGVLTWSLTRGSAPATSAQLAKNAKPVSLAALSQRVNEDMDTLFSVMGESGTTTNTAQSTASNNSSTTAGSRVDWLDELVEEGRSS